MKSVLVIDDDPEFIHLSSLLIEHLGHIVSTSDSVADAKQWLSVNQFDHVFIDFMLPDGSGLEIYDLLIQKHKIPKITFITGNPKIKQTISELTGPTVDYVLKPVQKEDFEKILNSPTKPSRVSKTTKKHFGCLIGESAVMKGLYNTIEKVAKSNANVMLMGESGSGKELFAEAIHNASAFDGGLITTNCGAFSKELIGSELFGHEKGAFTGAVGQKIGVFERAKNGTLFLDEVTEMPIDMQPTLLRVLESRRLIRVGGTSEIDASCRVISATNRSIESIANDNLLREDIYFRLAVFPIEIPPLRDRKEDVPLLVNYFIDQLNDQQGESLTIQPQELTRLVDYDWPGNVRELRHTIHRAFIMADEKTNTITLPDSFVSPFSKVKNQQSTSLIQPGTSIETLEKELIFATLDEVKGNKGMAANMLGISTKTLYNRLQAYGETA